MIVKAQDLSLEQSPPKNDLLMAGRRTLTGWKNSRMGELSWL